MSSKRQSVVLSFPSHQPPQTASWFEKVLKAAKPYRASGRLGISQSSSNPKLSTRERGPASDCPPNKRMPGGETVPVKVQRDSWLFSRGPYLVLPFVGGAEMV